MNVHEVQSHRLEIERVVTPATLDDALEALEAHGERARLVAGGSDLLLEIARGARQGVRVLVDVSRVAGLDVITFDGDTVAIGAGVTHNQVVRSPLIGRYGIPLAQACHEIGSPQLRNRATVVGNVVTASPANDTISALVALDATVTLVSSSGRRVVPLPEFHTGVRRTVLRPDEMVTMVSFLAMPSSARGVFVKLGLRRAQAISVVHLAIVLDFDGEVVAAARIALGSVGPTILRAVEAEARLVGSSLGPDDVTEAARLVAAAGTPIDDLRASASHRTDQLAIMSGRALEVLRAGQPPGPPEGAVALWGAGDGRITPRHEAAEHDATTPVVAIVNGRPVSAAGAVSKTLLDWLREDAAAVLGSPLTGTKEGCAEGECGACTVFLDGAAVRACLVPATRAHGAEIITVEGLAGSGALHPLQQAFVDRAAVQCGFCTPGFVMAGAKLLEEKERPDHDDIRRALAGNLCRCTGYGSIIAAVRQAAGGAAQ